MNSLAAPPSPLSRAQRVLFWLTALAVAVTRIWARAATIWDWDEAQFALALRQYDVVLHQPHPPGFPLFAGVAKLLNALLPGTAALQVVVVLSACALFPLLFALARELRFPFASAWAGALLFVFLPNVWFFGGSAFSDIPGLALLLGACVLLMRGCRDARSYYAGALVLGLAAAIRPQALIVACVPALVASWHRVRRTSLLALVYASLTGLAVIGISYAAAAYASSSVDGYMLTLRQLREYVREVDSYLSPERPPLGVLWPRFFVAPVPGGDAAKVMAALSLLAVIGAGVVLLRRGRDGDRLPARWSVWLVLAMFLPFNLFGFLMLDYHSLSRYSIGYAAMYALLAAQAVTWLTSFLRRAGPVIAMILVAALAARFAWWTVPAIRQARETSAPSVAAVEWVRANTPADAQLYVHNSLRPFSRLVLGDRLRTEFDEIGELQLSPAGRDEWFLTEGSWNCLATRHFIRERGRAFELVRERYFEVSVMPRSCMAVHGEGWYGEEWVGKDSWRWMGARSVMRLSPVAGPATLRLVGTIPREVVPRRPTMTITLNGAVVERFVPTGFQVDRTWTVTPSPDGWNELVIETDRTINPAKEGLFDDGRDLGFQLLGYGWEGGGEKR